jgi:hypothetical protein
MGRFRTVRWVFALMLIASPAIGGQVAPLIHPCEVAEGASHHGSGSDADHGEHHSAPADAPDTQCSCIGACFAPALPAPPASVVTTAAWQLPAPSAPRISATPELPPFDPPLLRLPPATPPPTA